MSLEAQDRTSLGSTVESWLALALCTAVVLAWGVERVVPQADPAQTFAAPEGLAVAAALVAATGALARGRRPASRRLEDSLLWTGLLLLVWAANGLPFDLLTAAGLIGRRTASGDVVLATVYWPGLMTRALAIAAAVLIGRAAIARSSGRTPAPSAWYGYAAFALALPYPLLRVHWALGGTIGLSWPGAGGEGWEPLLIAIPWGLAAVLSLLLVSPRARIPRRLLLAGGWAATATVAMIGPAAAWSLFSAWAGGADIGSGGIAGWVFALFYGSWFLWAIAAAAATRSYQVRSAVRRQAG